MDTVEELNSTYFYAGRSNINVKNKNGCEN